MSTLEEIFDMPKKHKPNRAVKSHLARNFNVDGNLFIERYDQAAHTDSILNRSFRAKAIVDLSMSIECSLKSMICSLSKDSEKPSETYKKIRKLSHNLEKLYIEVETRSKGRFKIPHRNQNVFDDLKNLGVGSRYSYDVWFLLFDFGSRSFFLGNNIISKTIDEPDWSSKVRKEAIIWNKTARKCHAKYLEKHAILTGKKFETVDNALKKFLSEI